MYIRNYKGDLVKIDLSKINNEKELVNKLWKIQYNKTVKDNKDHINEIKQYTYLTWNILSLCYLVRNKVVSTSKSFLRLSITRKSRYIN